MECIKFDYEKSYIKEFINLPKRLYSKDRLMEDSTTLKLLLLDKHPLSKYFKLNKFIVVENNKTVGRFCITIYENDENAYIGFYECIDDEKVSKYIFENAKKFVKEKGYKKIIGPVDASFWIKYRLKINLWKELPYTGEPYNKEYYYNQFLENDFTVCNHYISNIFPVISKDYINGKFEDRYKSFSENGYSIISPDIKNYEKIMEELYYLITDLYSDFPIYKDLKLQDFKEVFRQYKSIINCSMVKMAYYNNKAVGFFISIPNYNNIVYNLNICNILKILRLRKRPKEYVMLYMGVDKNHTGLGKALIGAIEEELKENQLPSIGALAHDGKITQNYGQELVEDRYEYVLMECRVDV